MKNNQIILEPEKIYHIYNRANGSEKLFTNENQYYEFLQKYAVYIHPIVDTMAYCLLPNHFHLLVKVKKEEELLSFFKEQDPLYRLPESLGLSGSLSRQFGRLFSSYTQWLNKKTDRNGSLFTPNFKRKAVEDPFYFTELLGYIHTNPVKHGYIEDAMDWTFSSIHAYCSNLKSRVKTDIILDFFGGSKEDLLDFHRNYNEKVVEMQGLGLE